jgi:hypothetical protein
MTPAERRAIPFFVTGGILAVMALALLGLTGITDMVGK